VVRGRELKIEAASSREDPILETDHTEPHPVPDPPSDAWYGTLGTAFAVDAGVSATFAPLEYVHQHPSAYEQLSVPGAGRSRAGPVKDFY
jgi:hypothetical protein